MRTFFIIALIAAVIVNTLFAIWFVRKHSNLKKLNAKKWYKRNNSSEYVIEVLGTQKNGDYLCRWLFDDGKPFVYPKQEFTEEFIKLTKKEIIEMSKVERHKCERRIKNQGNIINGIKPDYWRKYPNGDMVCSYCGSLHPDSVIAIVKEFGAGVIERSDKDYKWYINRPTVANALEGGIKYYRQHDTPEFIKAILLLTNNNIKS